MEDKGTTSPPNPSLESEGDDDLFPSGGFEIQKVGSELDGNSGHVARQVRQFYFVKLWPTDPHSISQIKKKESVVEKMNQDLRQITERIQEKMSERGQLKLQSLDYCYWEWRDRLACKGKILNDLYVALDELCFHCFANNAPKRRSNKTCFTTELENHKLNFLMLHGSRSLTGEKQVLRDVNTQQRDVASFSSLEVLKKTINRNDHWNHCQNLLRKIEQFQIQRERAAGDASVKGKISNHVSLKRAVEDQIKLFCDDALENRREGTAHATRIRRVKKEKGLEAKNKVIHSLRTKLTEKSQKKDEAYKSILKLRNLHDGEITHYYEYRSFINNVHKLAEEKDVAALDELSCSEVGQFMLEWNSNKAFREDYEKKVQRSLERRQLSRDGRRRQNTSCGAMPL